MIKGTRLGPQDLPNLDLSRVPKVDVRDCPGVSNIIGFADGSHAANNMGFNTENVAENKFIPRNSAKMPVKKQNING